MKKVTNFTPKEGLNTSHRREKGFHSSYTLFDIADRDTMGRPSQVVEIRVYWGGETCYACAWVGYKYANVPHSVNGSAKAGGYGYDKIEQACKHALISAGFEFDTNHRELQPEDALSLIADYLGLIDTFVFKAHA